MQDGILPYIHTYFNCCVVYLSVDIVEVAAVDGYQDDPHCRQWEIVHIIVYLIQTCEQIVEILRLGWAACHRISSCPEMRENTDLLCQYVAMSCKSVALTAKKEVGKCVEAIFAVDEPRSRL